MFGSAFSITDGSGVFISSLTLTIIVSAIVIVGIVLVAVIITLAVLLSSCINRSTTTVEEKTYSGLCASYHINAELNNVQDSVFPAVCEEYMLNYLHGGQYLKDIEVSVDLAQSYLRTLQLQHDQKNAVILDIDETALSSVLHSENIIRRNKGSTNRDWNTWLNDTMITPIVPVLALYQELLAANWTIIFISERAENKFDLTVKSLQKYGYENWTSLILRSSDDSGDTVQSYKLSKRKEIENQGYQIMAVLGDQWSDIAEPAPFTKTFKLPNPFYRVI
ncbi:hypothetical protein KP509_05G103800 [Ceratopteris richardii]|nr:hypothetical protein KP509_05G103800 [Ceratopteris richardii]